MAGEKVASVKLQLNNRGFIASARQLEGFMGSIWKRIANRASIIGTSIRGWVRAASDAGKALGAAIRQVAKDPFGSMTMALRRLEAKSISSFKKIGAAAKSAFGWTATKLFGGAQRDPKTGHFLPGGGKGLLSGFSLTGGKGAGALAMAGAFAAKDALIGLANRGISVVEDANRVSEMAAQISTTARQSGQQYIDPKILESEAYAVTQDVKGTTAESALDAMAKFLTLTGDLSTARASLKDFATASKATGADMGAIAEATASISKQFGITDPNQIREVFAALTAQGKAGAIELPDLAAGLQSLAAAGAAFGMDKGPSGIKKLGGLTQVARSGAGGAAQTFTALQNVFKMLLEKSDDFKKERVNVFTGKGANRKTRQIDDVLIDAISKVGGMNMEKKSGKLSELFGGEAMQAINPLMAIYSSAVQGTQGSDKDKQAAGVAALRNALEGAVNAAGTWDDVVSDAAQMQATNSAKLTATFENLKSKVGDAVLPKLTDLADKILANTDAIDLFVTGLEIMAEAANDFASFLKSVGLLDERKKSSTELRDEAQARGDKLRSELASLQSHDQRKIDEEEARDPEGVAKKRARAKQLMIDIAGADAEQKHWNDFANRGGFEWDNDDQHVKKVRGNKSLKDKFQAQQEAAKAAAPQAAVPAQPTPQAASLPAALTAPKGPINIGNTVRVHVTGDDTQRGNAGVPTPGRAPRP